MSFLGYGPFFTVFFSYVQQKKTCFVFLLKIIFRMQFIGLQLVHPKMKILSGITHPHVITNPQDFHSSSKHKAFNHHRWNITFKPHWFSHVKQSCLSFRLPYDEWMMNVYVIFFLNGLNYSFISVQFMNSKNEKLSWKKQQFLFWLTFLINYLFWLVSLLLEWLL